MKECSAFKSLLSLFSGGELNREEFRRVDAHLIRCVECRQEEEQFSQVIRQARKAAFREYHLSESVRHRIALEAASRVSRKHWGFPMPVFPLPVRPGLLAAMAAIVVALIVLPLAKRHGAGPVGRPPEVSAIRVTTDGTVVRLAWSDGSHDSYRVYKSSDARSLSGAEVHVVKGNVWTDRDPESSPIVFYRIE